MPTFAAPLRAALAALLILAASRSAATAPHTAARPARLEVPILPASMADAHPLPAYPRPDFARDHWLGLNGVWRFALDPDGTGQARGWYRPDAAQRFAGRIIVPFPWQSLAAFGQDAHASQTVVNGPLALYAGTVWYARQFGVPAAFPRVSRLLLTFGAAEQSARVWVNGRYAGSHEGGYLPFTLDISGLAYRAGRPNSLVVAVTQPADLTGYPHGKQGGSWYSRSGGLWQSVWLEAAGEARIDALRSTPDAARGRVSFTMHVAGAAFAAAGIDLRITDPHDRPAARLYLRVDRATGRASATATLAHPLLWDVEHPWLYQVRLTVQARAADGADLAPDVVHSYVGLRTVGVGRITVHGRSGAAERYPYVFLNGHPIYIRGALDQDFNPAGIYTAPSDDFLRDEVLRAKALGLNLLRIHIKAPDPRLLYWADRLGLLIWEEPPDFAEDGASFTPEALRRWQNTLFGMIDRDFNHPSTIIWGLFNEEWGTGDLRQSPARAAYLAALYAEVKQRDPTRLVVDQSGWSHTRTDLVDLHQYLADWGGWRLFLDRLNLQLYKGAGPLCGCISGSHDGFVAPYTYGDQPVLLSEYAAGPWTGDWPNRFDARPDGFRDNAAPFRWLTNDLRLHPLVAGYIYTQFSDVEWEHNGLMRYDRVPRQFGYAPPGLFPDFTDVGSPRMVNAAEYLAIDARPISAVDPGGALQAVVWLSRFGTAPHASTAVLHWRLAGYNGAGAWQIFPTQSLAVHSGADALARLATIRLRAPLGAFAGDLAVWLTGGGATIARNAVAVIVRVPVRGGLVVSSRQTGRTVARGLTWTFEPGDFSAAHFSRVTPVREAAGQVAWGSGDGYLEYRLALPAAATARGRLTGLVLHAEASAEQRGSVLDQSAPQTDARPSPSDLTVSVDGVRLAAIVLPNDPADARGILSLWNGYEWGEYGYPVIIRLAGADARLAALAARLGQAGAVVVRFGVPAGSAYPGGLALYGERAGRIPAPLSLQLTFS